MEIEKNKNNPHNLTDDEDSKNKTLTFIPLDHQKQEQKNNQSMVLWSHSSKELELYLFFSAIQLKDLTSNEVHMLKVEKTFTPNHRLHFLIIHHEGGYPESQYNTH